jgi:two-component system response regulator FixJ
MSDGRMIAVVDDDDAVRQSTSRLLTRAGHRVHSFPRGEAFLQADLPANVDCILLDIRMPGLSGIDVLRALKDRPSVPPVIVLTGHGDVPLAVEAMKLGAAEFLEKPFPPDLLLRVLERVWTERSHAEKEDGEKCEAGLRVGALTPRQRQVLRGIALGQPNKIIAFNLGLSTRTVEAYRAQLLDKLGVRSTAEAVRIALHAGIADPA